MRVFPFKISHLGKLCKFFVCILIAYFILLTFDIHLFEDLDVNP